MRDERDRPTRKSISGSCTWPRQLHPTPVSGRWRLNTSTDRRPAEGQDDKTRPKTSRRREDRGRASGVRLAIPRLHRVVQTVMVVPTTTPRSSTRPWSTTWWRTGTTSATTSRLRIMIDTYIGAEGTAFAVRHSWAGRPADQQIFFARRTDPCCSVRLYSLSSFHSRYSIRPLSSSPFFPFSSSLFLLMLFPPTVTHPHLTTSFPPTGDSATQMEIPIHQR